VLTHRRQIKAACNGDLTKVKRIVKLVGYVQSDADFQQHAAVIDGASDLMIQVCVLSLRLACAC